MHLKENVLENSSNYKKMPTISIIIPSLNQGRYLKETLNSVLFQKYPKTEIILIDGNSTDGTLDVIHSFEKDLYYWQSKPDHGQADAINQGLAMATGEVVAWINSDDTYIAGTLYKVAKYFSQSRDNQAIYGNAYFIDDNDVIIGEYKGSPLSNNNDKYKFWRGWPIPQPTLFFRRDIVKSFGFLDTSYKYAMDYEWLMRINKNISFTYIDNFLANYRLHGESKTGNWDKNKWKFYKECQRANKNLLQMKNLDDTSTIIKGEYYYYKSLIKGIFYSVGIIK